MKVIDPYYQIQDELDRESLAIRLEACGRICYKSEDMITEDSALPFVTKVAAHGHNSVLEMAVVTLQVDCSPSQAASLMGCQPKFLIIDRKENSLLITGSVRAFRELYQKFPDNEVVHSLTSFLGNRHPYLFEGVWNAKDAWQPERLLEIKKMPLDEVEELPADLLLRHRYVGVKFFVNRAVTHEIVRHRPCSFLQESQRYCRYSQDKFDNQVTFIKPMFYKEDSLEYDLWVKAMTETEAIYLKLLETSTPQAARTVLPNSCKTEIIVYCNLEEWRHIFKLRTSNAAEPSMREIMIPLADEIRKRYPAME
jgi:thymidylate synthase (FAD)